MHVQFSFAVASYVYVTFCVHVAVCIVTWLMCFICAKKADSHTVAYHVEMVVASTVGGLLACTLAHIMHALRLKALPMGCAVLKYATLCFSVASALVAEADLQHSWSGRA